MSKNFNLTFEEYELLLTKLRSGDEELFEKIFLHHFEDCVKQLQAKYKCSQGEAYDATMDTIIDFRMKIKDGRIKYGNLEYLFFLIASQVLMRSLKKFKISEFYENLIDDQKETYSDEDVSILEKAWIDLSDECQKLLTRNFYHGMKLIEIAQEENRTHLAIRKHKRRCLDKLVMYYTKYSRLYK